MVEKVKFIGNNAAVDAAILVKERTFEGIVRYSGYSLEEMAAIGDEVTDVAILSTPGLGLAGTVANAQQRVIDAVRNLPNGYVSPGEVFDGFMDFYEEAARRGIRFIVSDKDGVLKGDKLDESVNVGYGKRFRELALHMGEKGKPYVSVLTGSSIKQNYPFMKQYGLDRGLDANPRVRGYPYLLLVENGAIHLDVIHGGVKNYVVDLDPELLEVLKGEFEERVKLRLETEVLPELSLRWANGYDDQAGAVYHAREKLSMVTFNVPRAFPDGRPYRKSSDAGSYRKMTIDRMVEEAETLGMPYEVL